MKIFEITITCHDQYGIELYDDGSIDYFQIKKDFLKRCVCDNYTESEYYKAKDKVKPFIQSYTDNFIMVEFWTKDFEAIEKYVNFLNEKYNLICKK